MLTSYSFKRTYFRENYHIVQDINKLHVCESVVGQRELGGEVRGWVMGESGEKEREREGRESEEGSRAWRERERGKKERKKERGKKERVRKEVERET